jgi:hypothetical protein
MYQLDGRQMVPALPRLKAGVGRDDNHRAVYLFTGLSGLISSATASLI